VSDADRLAVAVLVALAERLPVADWVRVDEGLTAMQEGGAPVMRQSTMLAVSVVELPVYPAEHVATHWSMRPGAGDTE
jgi:hypothetical protein